MLTLGIPGSGTTVLLGALVALSITPGPRLMEDQPEVLAVIISMYLEHGSINPEPAADSVHCKTPVPRHYLIPFGIFSHSSVHISAKIMRQGSC